MSVVHEAWKAGLALDLKVDIPAWGNEFRYLSSKGAAEHGKYDINRMPYLIGIGEELSPSSPTQFVYVCKGVQLGFTELGNNMLFTYADLYPCPMLMVFPTRSLLKKHLDSKFWSGVEVTPRLQGVIKPVKQGSINSSSTDYIKFPGGYIAGVWSESKSSFASGSYRIVYFSDLDRFPDDVEGEGDTISLGVNRANSFSTNRKIFGESSPTKKLNSKIYNEVMNGDQRRYFMKCSNCSMHIDFQKDDFIYEYDEESYQLSSDVKCACKHCGSTIEEYEKFEMMKIENGAKWIPTNLKWTNKLRKTYFIGAYYSPFLTWNEMFQEYLDAIAEKENLGRTHKLKVWYNTMDGTTWEDTSDKPKEIPLEVQDLIDRQEVYDKVPADVVVLTAGVDTQGDRFEATVLGWKNSREKYVIAHYIIVGDPASMVTQKKLDELLFKKFFASENGGAMKIFASAIDTGGNKTNAVYEYVRRRKNRNLFAIKGGRSIDDPLVKDATVAYTKTNKPLKLYVLGVNSGKDEVYEDIKEEFGQRYIYFGTNIIRYYDENELEKLETSDADYFKQLLAESCDSNGRWINEKKRRNEAIDCLLYAHAPVKIKNLNIDKLKKLNIKVFYKKG